MCDIFVRSKLCVKLGKIYVAAVVPCTDAFNNMHASSIYADVLQPKPKGRLERLACRCSPKAPHHLSIDIRQPWEHATRPFLPTCLRTAGTLSHVHTRRVCRVGSVRFAATWDQAIRRPVSDASANRVNASFQKNARGRGNMRLLGEVLRATLASGPHVLAMMVPHPRI